jgi:glucokinase
MSLLAIDLGGTKLAMAVLSEDGILSSRQIITLNGRTGNEAGSLIADNMEAYLQLNRSVKAIGVAVPGIYSKKDGTVWAPNIAGWESYPLLKELQNVAGSVPVVIDSDRACYISGEVGYGNAKGCSDAIFIAVGTGIGAGIISGGNIIRGAHDIAGAIGWMALERPFQQKYVACGCFEYNASGEGIAKVAKENSGVPITAQEVFKAYEKNDEIAERVIDQCIQFWGMAVANLVSVFNPEKIIFGGGVFGPASQFIPQIREEAAKWAQPISMQRVKIEPSALGSDAGLYGAGYLALQSVIKKYHIDGV